MKRIELVDHDLVIYSKGKDRVSNDAHTLEPKAY